ncbi:hypothetical protein, partial [Roseivivax halotolerans]|uniref:hypothetical protein n=1 Tax=Roseivivax halotolerans TaxID=93684 RepID=UPI001C316F88
PRLRPLLTPPNDGTQKENRLDLRVALKKGAGHYLNIFDLACIPPVIAGRVSVGGNKEIHLLRGSPPFDETILTCRLQSHEGS